MVGKVTIIRALLYIVGQLIGSIIGAGLLRFMLPGDYFNSTTSSFGVTQPCRKDLYNLSIMQAIIIEFVITAVLVFTVFASIDNENKKDQYGLTPLMIGLSIVVCHLFAVYILQILFLYLWVS